MKQNSPVLLLKVNHWPKFATKKFEFFVAFVFAIFLHVFSKLEGAFSSQYQRFLWRRGSVVVSALDFETKVRSGDLTGFYLRYLRGRSFPPKIPSIPP